MKVAIITDQHFGARSDSVVFLDFFEKFYRDIFFPKCLENKINTVLILGDTFDRRKYTNHYSLMRAKQMFFDIMLEYNMQVYMIAGNHDTTFKNTNDVNTPDILLKEYPNIEVIYKPKTITVDNIQICMVPWICADNFYDCMEEVKNTTADICMGHFEIAGFSMYRGMESQEGLDTSLFDKFSTVFSGHYHHRSHKDQIHYLGTPYEMTWQDYNDTKGFHFFDPATLDLEFIPNTNNMFVKYYYNDSIRDELETDFSMFEEKEVKICVEQKTDFYIFEKFLERVYKQNCHDVKIIEDFSEIVLKKDADIKVDDTEVLIKTYVSSLETPLDKERVYGIFKSLYNEALLTED
jgi:DNA repair exonuclease SbcCD nuclease subunit